MSVVSWGTSESKTKKTKLQVPSWSSVTILLSFFNLLPPKLFIRRTQDAPDTNLWQHPDLNHQSSLFLFTVCLLLHNVKYKNPVRGRRARQNSLWCFSSYSLTGFNSSQIDLYFCSLFLLGGVFRRNRSEFSDRQIKRWFISDKTNETKLREADE